MGNASTLHESGGPEVELLAGFSFDVALKFNKKRMITCPLTFEDVKRDYSIAV
jgi:hypothetical protein